MSTKMRGISIYRKDATVPMTDVEQKMAKKLNVSTFYYPKKFNVRINAAIPYSHKMCK